MIMEAFVQGIGIVGGFGTGMETFSKTLANGLSEIQVVTVQTPDGTKEMPSFLADTSGLETFVREENPSEDGPHTREWLSLVRISPLTMRESLI